MANLAGVLKELKQERTSLDQAIDVIGKLVGRNGTGGKTVGPRPKANTLRGGTTENSGSSAGAVGKSEEDASEEGRVGESTESFKNMRGAGDSALLFDLGSSESEAGLIFSD